VPVHVFIDMLQFASKQTTAYNVHGFVLCCKILHK